MTEKTIINEEVSLGKIEIAPEVIEVITGIAASEVKGVSSMRGNFATDVVEKLGGTSHSKGVKVDLTEQGIIIDLFVVVSSGVSIPGVAVALQTNIRQTIMNMTALEVSEVNIHIVGIEMEEEYSKV